MTPEWVIPKPKLCTSRNASGGLISDHLEIGITIDDPKAYTKPWTATMKVDLLPDTELLETTCENSKGLEHLVGK